MEVPFYSFGCGYPVVPAPFVEKTILSTLNDLAALIKNQLMLHLRVRFQILHFILMCCAFIFTYLEVFADFYHDFFSLTHWLFKSVLCNFRIFVKTEAEDIKKKWQEHRRTVQKRSSGPG